MMHNGNWRFAAVLLGGVLWLHSAAVLIAEPRSSQQPDPKKFQHAINRSADAARIVSLLAVAPESGIPKELTDKAEAIGVFPKVTKETALFVQGSEGYGVISSRQGQSWSLPAFYKFEGGGYGNPFARTETHAVILLFMTKESVDWFQKGGVPLENERKAIAGPVGTISDAQRKELEEAGILAYAYYNGQVNGTAFGKRFWKNFSLNPDNNINNPVYGKKGRQVLAGASINSSEVLPGISAYQEALQKSFPR
jgi:lipid-binding SYLF domain-containing protein